jgi:hypothetical protein
LETAAYIGLAVVVLLIVVGVALFTTETPLRWVGRVAQSVLNATVKRRHPLEGVAEELIADRDFIVNTIGRRWRAALVSAVGNSAFDYLALLCALRAVGASPRPSLVILAYASAELLAQIPFTPGGLGFVEAGLVGTLSLAGVPGSPPSRRRFCIAWCRTGSRSRSAGSRTSRAAADTDRRRGRPQLGEGVDAGLVSEPDPPPCATVS